MSTSSDAARLPAAAPAATSTSESSPAACCAGLIAEHVAESTHGGRVLFVLELDAARGSSVFKFPPLEDDVAGSLRRTPRCIAVYELPPRTILTHRVAHARAMLQAQGPLAFRADGATGAASAAAQFAPKNSFDADGLAAPVELHRQLGTGTGTGAGGVLEKDDIVRGVLVAKVEVAALCQRLESGDPRYVAALRGDGAAVVGAASPEAQALLRLVRDVDLGFASAPDFALSLGGTTLGLVRKLKARATPSVVAATRAKSAKVAAAAAAAIQPAGGGAGGAQRLTKAEKRAENKAAAKALKRAKAATEARQLGQQPGHPAVEQQQLAAVAAAAKPSNVPDAATLREGVSAAELRAQVELLACNCRQLAALVGTGAAGVGGVSGAAGGPAAAAAAEERVDALERDTLAALRLRDGDGDSNGADGRGRDLAQLLKQWERYCAVSRKMPAIKALANPTLKARRRTALRAWHTALRRASLEQLKEVDAEVAATGLGGDATGGGCGAAGQDLPPPAPELVELLHVLDPGAKHVDVASVVFAQQTGSAMYNLATKSSDEDYLIVVANRPTLAVVLEEVAAVSSHSTKRGNTRGERMLHPAGDRAFGADKSDVAEGKVVDLEKYVANLCKGNPVNLEPLLLHCRGDSAGADAAGTAANAGVLAPVHTSWVWREFAEQHALRCLHTRRCLVQFAGFVGNRLHSARQALQDAAAATSETAKADAWGKCAKYLCVACEEVNDGYHALHKLHCLEATVAGHVPQVCLATGSPAHTHIMRVRAASGGGAGIDLQAELDGAEKRLGAAKSRIEADRTLPDEVDFAALSAWLLSVRVRLYRAETNTEGGPAPPAP